VVVENEAGPQVPDTATAAEPEQEIDLGTFYREFIRPGVGTANVFVDVDGAEAQAHVTDLLDRIERNYHGLARPS
jgi:hypothetical protein